MLITYPTRAANSVCCGVPLSPLARYHPCAICIVSRETWRSACSLFAIDIQSVQCFIIFACVTKEEDDRVRDGFSCKNVKNSDGACADHLVIRIPTDDIHLLLFQNAYGEDFCWVKATVHIHPFVCFNKGNRHGCVVNGKVCRLLGRVIDEFCVPTARIPVLDYE